MGRWRRAEEKQWSTLGVPIAMLCSSPNSFCILFVTSWSSMPKLEGTPTPCSDNSQSDQTRPDDTASAFSSLAM
jgi:hypothetical protein